MRRLMQQARVDLLLTDEPALLDAPWSHRLSEIVANAVNLTGEMSCSRFDFRVVSNEPGFVFQTSGTTGEPKWVTCSYSKCRAAIDAMCEVGALEHARHQSVFITPPLYHSYGLSAFLEYTSVGGCALFPQGNSPLGPIGELQARTLRERVSAIEGVPWLYLQLAKLARRTPLPKLTHIGLGGGPLDPAVFERLLVEYRNVTVSVRYGLTETPSVVTHKVFRPPYLDSWQSSGRLIPAYQIEIVDEQGRPLGPRQEGEIVVRGESLEGYRGRDGEDLRTGDLGFLSEADELFIVGRRAHI